MEVQRKPKISALVGVVVSVGVVPPAHFIVVNQVTVRLPVASCNSLRTILSPAAILDNARVLFPQRVTE